MSSAKPPLCLQLVVALLVPGLLIAPTSVSADSVPRTPSAGLQMANGAALLIIEVTDPPAPPLTPTVTDDKSIQPPLTYTYDASASAPSAKPARFQFRVTTSGPSPDHVQIRPVVVSFEAGGGHGQPLSFALLPGNPTSSRSLVTIAPPVTPFTMTGGLRWTALSVTNTVDTPIKLMLTRSTLVDARPGKGSQLPIEQLHLCLEPPSKATCDADAVTISNVTHTVWLDVDNAFVSDGIFAGVVQLTTLPASDPTTVSLTIQQSRGCAQMIGVLMIVLGVTVAWFALAFGRGRVARNQALLPAVLLRQRASALLVEIDALDPKLTPQVVQTRREASTILSELTEVYLDAQGYLPPPIPSMNATPPQTAAYQTHLQSMSSLLDGLETIVWIGIEPSAAKLPQVNTSSDLQQLQKLVSDLDALTATLPSTSQALQAAITPLLAAWHPAIVAQTAGYQSLVIKPGPGKQRSAFQLLAQIATVSIAFWIVWGTLSVLAGYLVLIATDGGFGGSLDYIRCALWGFGLPVAGQSLQQLTLGSINTQLGVTLSH